MRTRTLCLVLLAALPALARADDGAAEVEARVKALLGAIDSPASAERWRALGEPGVTALAAVAQDAAAMPTRRARAVNALGAVGGARAAAAVTALAASERPPFAVRAAALRALPGVVDAEALPSHLRPVLQGAAAAPVRAVAAQVLARHAPSACGDVRAQAARERTADRAAFTAALRSCGEP